MTRIGWTRGCLLLMTAAVLTGQQNAELPRYSAVELNLDGAVRDAGVNRNNELVGGRGSTTGGTRAFVRRANREIDLHPAHATSSVALAGDAETQVGSAAINSHSHAMVWSGASDSAVDLHEALPQWYTDSIATGIDDAGNVTGVAIDSSGVAHDILWRAGRPKITMSGGSSGEGGGNGGGGGGNTATDKISITRALWFGNAQAAPTGELLVQATSSSSNAVLTLTDTTTGEVISTLPNIGGGRYGGSVIFRFNPVISVTVTSNLGGTATRPVIIGVQ